MVDSQARQSQRITYCKAPKAHVIIVRSIGGREVPFAEDVEASSAEHGCGPRAVIEAAEDLVRVDDSLCSENASCVPGDKIR